MAKASVLDILEQLESTSSRNEKEEILERHRSNELLKRVFVAALDIYTTYGVAKWKMPKPLVLKEHHQDDSRLDAFLTELLPKLAERELTGNAAREAVERLFGIMDSRMQKWCQRILLRNLRCGVDTTPNRVWPGLIPTFSVQLAESLDAVHIEGQGITFKEEVQYPVRVEPKLDGLRLIAIKRNGKVTLHTRNGNELDTLPKIVATLEAAPYDNIVLDGESMGETWNDTASIMMAKKTKKDDTVMRYNVFDIMPLDHWLGGKEYSDRAPLSRRLVWLDDFFKLIPKGSPVVRVPGHTAANQKELMSFYHLCLDQGHEGIMLKDLSAPYAFKRNDAILKLKPIKTFEGVIVGHYTGRRGTKHEGVWSGFEVVFPNGIVTKVGGGYNDKFRAAVQLEGPDSYIGKIVEVEGQPDPLTDDGYTVDGKVRFPVYTRFRDARDVDPKVMFAYNHFNRETA